MDPDTLRRLLMQLLAPLIILGSKRMGIDLGPIVDSALVLGVAVYVGFSNWKAVKLSEHATAVAVAASPVPAPAPTAAPVAP
jgi:hypothetical protein